MNAAQLEARRHSIGASDISGVLGLSKWKTLLSVYLDKVEGKEDTTSTAAEIGLILEPWLLLKGMDWIAEIEGVAVTIDGDQKHYTHPDHDFITATPDGIMVHPARGTGDMECKTAGEYHASEWPEGGLPDEYYAQVQCQMAVTGWEWVYVFYVIGNRKFDVRFVPRNQAFIDVLIERAVDFWTRFVIPKVPPAPSGADIDTDLLKAMYPGGGEEILELGMEDEREEYKSIAAEMKVLEGRKKAIQQQFMSAMGNNELALVGDKKITWKTVEKKEYTVKATSYRSLRIG